MSVGISVTLDGEPSVCIACAERCANDSGFVNIFWMMNSPRICDGSEMCPECHRRMDSDKAQEAAVRVAEILESNGELAR